MGASKQARMDNIIKVLAAQPEGIWLRNLSKITKVPPATLHRYLERDLSDIVDNLGIKDGKGNHFGLRIIRLKPKVVDIIREGGLERLRKFLEISKNI
ncbi:MAG: hypothetical protein JW727_00665 [Candidatus Aenigmarchaeota archaeon]|nr:hypothetical protein [Candidatus Aenigmarchaeota archaeon]